MKRLVKTTRLAGVSDIDSTNDSIIKTALKRLPWLIILTFLGMITATILGRFENIRKCSATRSVYSYY